MKGLLPFSATDPNRFMPGTPVGQLNGLDRVTGTGTNQSKLMTATASAIANAKALTAPARGRIGTAGGFPWRNGFRGRKRRLLAYMALLVAGICAAAAEEGQVTRPNEPMAFHIPSQPLATCRRKAKMSALSKVGMSVFFLLVVRFGGCGSDGRGVDEQTRTESH
jgi:hypothetical protein